MRQTIVHSTYHFKQYWQTIFSFLKNKHIHVKRVNEVVSYSVHVRVMCIFKNKNKTKNKDKLQIVFH